MIYYFDTSAVVKYYTSETGSNQVIEIIENGSSYVYISQIGIVEVAAALSKKMRTHEISIEDYKSSYSLFQSDILTKQYFIVQLNDQIVEVAVSLTSLYPLKGYDAVHLSSAITLNSVMLQKNIPPIHFISSDKTLCKSAKKEGLNVSDLNT